MGKKQDSRGDDAYDLKDEPSTRRAQTPQPAVLRYESKAVVQKEARERRQRILKAWRLKDLWLPVVLIALGLACRGLLMISHSTEGTARAAVIMALVALATAFNVLAMLAGFMFALRHVDLEPSPPAATIVKLGLIFVAGASAAGLTASLAHFDPVGIVTGVNLLFLVYWILFSLLFKASFFETLMSIAIIGVVQAVLNLAVWKL